MKQLIVFSCSLLLFSCTGKYLKVLTVKADMDLVPEGIAIHNDKLFLSSIYHNKIIEVNLKNNLSADFIKTNQHGFKSGIGIYTKDNLLFALANSTDDKVPQSQLFVFNIADKTLVKIFELKDGRTHLLNDMVIDDNNRIYITDTRQHTIFTIDYPGGNFTEYLSGSPINYPNGITISDDNKKLYVANWETGLRTIDIDTKKILNKPSVETRGIDGMKFYKNAIYAIKNIDSLYSKHGVYKISLSANNEEITKIDNFLTGHTSMNVPTTLDIRNNHLYILANSQLDNLNQTSNTITDKSKLTDTYILKIKIKNSS